LSDRDLITALKEGILHLDCVHMELSQNTEANPKGFIGKGYIYQDPEGIISFRLYVIEKQNASATADWAAFFDGGTAGKLYDDDKYYNLSATEYGGDHWTATRFLPSVSRYPNGEYVTGRIYTITRVTPQLEKRDTSYYQVDFFQNFQLPFTDYIDTKTATEEVRSLQAAKFESGCRTFDIREADADHLIVQAVAWAPFHPNFYMRIMESLTYVSAMQAFWRVIITADEKEQTLRLSSPRTDTSRPKLRRPVHTASLTDRRMFWRLFSKYLEFSVRNAPERGWHPCSVHIHNAIAASANSLDAWAVGLCVAVEGMANLFPVEEDKKETERSCQIITHVRDFLKAMGWTNDKVANRASGLVNQLHQPRVIDRLASLVAAGKISKELIEAWQKLRPRQAHGAVMDIESAPKEDIETMLQRIDGVTTLLYQLSFQLIEYKENYTDYSKVNWPTATVV
jgi:hypothetical protein